MSSHIQFRLDIGDMQLLEERAQPLGLSPNQLAREWVLEQLIAESPEERAHELAIASAHQRIMSKMKKKMPKIWERIEEIVAEEFEKL